MVPTLYLLLMALLPLSFLAPTPSLPTSLHPAKSFLVRGTILSFVLLLFLSLGSAQDLQVHCLEGGEPLQLPDPFPPSKEDGDFVSLGWYFRPFNVSGGEQDEDKLMLYSTFDEFKTIDAGRWELYNYWGLQVGVWINRIYILCVKLISSQVLGLVTFMLQVVTTFFFNTCK